MTAILVQVQLNFLEKGLVIKHLHSNLIKKIVIVYLKSETNQTTKNY